MKILYSTFSLFLLIFICGCSNPEKKALNSFKPIVTFLSGITNYDGKIEYSDFSYKIEKNDSITSPFTGEITFKSEEGIFVCLLTLQDNKWIHNSIKRGINDNEKDSLTKQFIKIDEKSEFDEEQKQNEKMQISDLIAGTINMEATSIDKQLSQFLKCREISEINQ